MCKKYLLLAYLFFWNLCWQIRSRSILGEGRKGGWVMFQPWLLLWAVKSEAFSWTKRANDSNVHVDYEYCNQYWGYFFLWSWAHHCGESADHLHTNGRVEWDATSMHAWVDLHEVYRLQTEPPHTYWCGLQGTGLPWSHQCSWTSCLWKRKHNRKGKDFLICTSITCVDSIKEDFMICFIALVSNNNITVDNAVSSADMGGWHCMSGLREQSDSM